MSENSNTAFAVKVRQRCGNQMAEKSIKTSVFLGKENALSIHFVIIKCKLVEKWEVGKALLSVVGSFETFRGIAFGKNHRLNNSVSFFMNQTVLI